MMLNPLRTCTVRYIGLLVFVLFLQACTSQAVKPPAPQTPQIAYAQRQLQVGQIEHWQLQARIAIKTSSDSNTGSLRWQQGVNNAVALDLKGPFGVNVAKIKGESGEYILQDRKGRSWQASNIDQLIYERTGWALPIEQLRYWVLADMQNSRDASYRSNADGTLQSLSFEQWQIQYETYTNINGILLPAKIRITHRDINIKLSIRKWSVGKDG